MSKVIKILLKNVIVVSFSVVIVMTAILSALITRHFDSKECDSKVQIYEARLKKEINSRLRDENVNFDKMMPVQKNDSKDIVVSVEIMKSESKQSINNGDNKQRNKKTAQKYDNKKKQKKTPINNKKTETKEKKKKRKNLKNKKKKIKIVIIKKKIKKLRKNTITKKNKKKHQSTIRKQKRKKKNTTERILKN